VQAQRLADLGDQAGFQLQRGVAVVGLDLVHIIEGQGIAAAVAVPQVQLRVGLQQSHVACVVGAFEAHAKPAGQLDLGIVVDMGDAVVGAVQRDLLGNQLGLWLQGPAFRNTDRVAGLQRGGPGVAIDVQLVAAVGAGAAIEPGVLQHAVEVPALRAYQRPVATDTVAVELEVTHTAVLHRQGKAFDVGVQAAVADVQAQVLAVAVIADLGIQVLAHLEAIQVTVQARADGATPLLAQRAAVGLAPAGRQAALVGQQLLIALALMEGAQRLAGNDCRTPGCSRVNRHFRAIQGQADTGHWGGQLGLAGGRCRHGRGCRGLDRRLAGFAWLFWLLWGGGRCCHQRRAQIPAVFTAFVHAAFEQPVVVGTDLQRLGLHKGIGAAGGAITGFDDLNAVLFGGDTRASEIVHYQARAATDGALADHQPVGGRVVAGEHAVNPQQAIVTLVVAIDGQAALGVVAGAQVDRARIAHAGKLP